MRISRLRWLAASAAVLGFLQSTGTAAIVQMTMAEWKVAGFIDLGDKRYTHIESGEGLDETLVTLLEDTTFNTHTLTVAGETTIGDTHTLEYMVSVLDSRFGIYRIDNDSDKQGDPTASVTTTVFDTLADMTADANRVATLVTLNGSPGGPEVFGRRSQLYIRNFVDETAGGSITSFSNTVYQSPVPEPSTWGLAALASGGLAVIRLRRSRITAGPPHRL